MSSLEKGSKFKASEKIPATGRYKCLVCGLIIEIQQKFIDMGSTFFSCPICHAGEDSGPKGPQDQIREYLG
ncbi:MAG: hypothetical protein WAZ12_03140 [Candidatus Absconditicoccaceae bacterium]